MPQCSKLYSLTARHSKHFHIFPRKFLSLPSRWPVRLGLARATARRGQAPCKVRHPFASFGKLQQASARLNFSEPVRFPGLGNPDSGRPGITYREACIKSWGFNIVTLGKRTLSAQISGLTVV